MLFTVYTERKNNKWEPSYPEAERVAYDMFSKFIIKSFLARTWPPYDHFAHPHIVTVIRFSKVVRDLMLAVEPRFSGWLNQRGLPEDLCLFQKGKRLPLFFSSALSEEGYLIGVEKFYGDYFAEWEDDVIGLCNKFELPNSYAFCQPWRSQRQMGGVFLKKFSNERVRVNQGTRDVKSFEH